MSSYLADKTEKITQLNNNALFSRLDGATQSFIADVQSQMGFTHQELIQLVDIATNLRMWRESTLEKEWQKAAKTIVGQQKQHRKKVIKLLTEQMLDYAAKVKDYPSDKPLRFIPVKKQTQNHQTDGPVFGLCPVYSEKTACCNLYTIDVAQGCGFGCSYCSIQSFYDPDAIAIEENLAEKLEKISLDPERTYHIGSGQSSDSLMWGNRNGILDAQFDFARKHNNVLLEFKTKSRHIRHFLKNPVPDNVVVSWSLNTQTIITNEEHLTASLDDRIASARALADKGVMVGFHIHPMVHYKNWYQEYEALFKRLVVTFQPHEVSFLSMGTLTFTKSSIKALQKKGHESKVLQMPLEDAAGKMSYPYAIKKSLFSLGWQALKPWHDKVFIYLCMEDKNLWDEAFGFSFADNAAFEQAFFDNARLKYLARTGG